MSEIKLYFKYTNENLSILDKCSSFFKNKELLKNKQETEISPDSPTIKNYATYNPPFIFNSHYLMNYYVLFFRNKPQKLNLKRDNLINHNDGGSFSLDWFYFEEFNQFPPNTPIIIVCHSLTGGSQECYIQHLARQAYNMNGMRVVVLNYRGCAGNKITSDIGYGPTKLDDLEIAIEFIKNNYPNAPLFMVGYSIGSMFITNHNLKYGEKSPISGYCCFSNPIDLGHCFDNMMKPYLSEYLYGRRLATHVKKYLFKFGDRLNKYATKQQIDKCISIRELDDLITCKMMGFKSAQEYYDESSFASKNVHLLKKPIMFINSKDDDVSPVTEINYEQFKSNENAILLLTEQGGHMGFISQDWDQWSHKACIEYFSTFISNGPRD